MGRQPGLRRAPLGGEPDGHATAMDEVRALADYGRPVAFGFFPEPRADQQEQVVAHVALAERLGLELVGVQDHPYQRRYLDTWTLLAWLAARTERIRLFPDVANLPLRPPAVLAKAVASLDLLSGGRVELGLGAGGFTDAVAAMGGPRRAPGDAVDALVEGLAVIRLLWSGERSVRYDGKHYRLSGVHAGPAPAHPLDIWVGGGGPRMLAVIGRLADGWLPSSPWAPPERLPELQERIDEAATSAGRRPADIRRLYNASGRITDGASKGFLEGPPDQWTDELTSLAVDHGLDSFILWAQEPIVDQLHRFAEDVVPPVRAAVTRARSSSNR